jgi:hypothetical protein
MRPYYNTAQGSLGEILDCITDGRERGYFPTEDARKMSRLCRRAMNANLKFLQSLRRKDP